MIDLNIEITISIIIINNNKTVFSDISVKILELFLTQFRVEEAFLYICQELLSLVLQ